MLKSIKIELAMTGEQKEEWKPMQIVCSNNQIPLSMLLEALHIPLDTMVRPNFVRGEWEEHGANLFNLEIEAKGRYGRWKQHQITQFCSILMINQ